MSSKNIAPSSGSFIGFIDKNFIGYSIDLEDMLAKYGKTVYVVAMEECAELQKALLLNDSAEAFNDVIEECVDVLIAISWLRTLVEKDTITVASMGYQVSAVKTNVACSILASSIQTFSKVYRGIVDLNSKTMQDTLETLSRLVVRLLGSNMMSKESIQYWVDKKLVKIEKNYKANKQH